MDLALVISNLGLFVATAGAAAIAWWQANVALVAAKEAKEDRIQALEANVRAAAALERQANAADFANLTVAQRRRAEFSKDLRSYAADIRDHAFDKALFPMTDQQYRKKLLYGEMHEFQDQRAVDLYDRVERFRRNLAGGDRSQSWAVHYLEQLGRDAAEWVYSQEPHRPVNRGS